MAVFESLRCRIAELEQRVADLEARLGWKKWFVFRTSYAASPVFLAL